MRPMCSSFFVLLFLVLFSHQVGMKSIATIKWLGHQTRRLGREQIGRYFAPIVLLASFAFGLFVPLIFALQPCSTLTPLHTPASAEYQHHGIVGYEAISDITGNNQLVSMIQSSPANTNCPIIVRQSNSPDASLVQSSYQVVLFATSLLLLILLIYRGTVAPPRKPQPVYLQPPLPPPIRHS